MKLTLEKTELIEIILDWSGAVSAENIEIQADPFQVVLHGLEMPKKKAPAPTPAVRAPAAAVPSGPPPEPLPGEVEVPGGDFLAEMAAEIPVPVVRGTKENPRELFPPKNTDDRPDPNRPKPDEFRHEI